MDVDVVLFVKILRKRECFAAAAHIGERRLCGFLHDITELSREDELPLAAQDVDLRAQDIAAHLCPCKPRNNADERFFLLLRRVICRLFEKFDEVRFCDADRRGLTFDDASRGFAAKTPDNALERAHARLACIGADNLGIDARGNTDVLRLQPVLGALARQEVTARDLDLLELGIAR